MGIRTAAQQRRSAPSETGYRDIVPIGVNAFHGHKRGPHGKRRDADFWLRERKGFVVDRKVRPLETPVKRVQKMFKR